MRYSPSQIEFYGTLGHAIVTWANVERALYFVYLRTVGSPISLVPNAAFFSIINFNAKLSMVDNAMAVRYYHYPDVLNRWSNIKNRLGKRAKKRNNLAHWQLLVVVKDNGDMVHTLTPQIFDPNPSSGAADRPSYTVADVHSMDLKFRECARELEQLADDLHATPRPEFRTPEDGHPNPQTQDDQTL
jgi:hypothetical protein